MSWIVNLITESRSNGRVTPELAAWVLSVVERALNAEYGANFSTRCLQSSECLRAVLASLGIRSKLIVGDLCVVTVYPGERNHNGRTVHFTWSGFWDNDHHVWLYTEFHELADLTISQLERHPKSLRPDALLIPAVWWQTIDQWPNILRYLPRSSFTIHLPQDEMEQLARIKDHAIVIAASETSLKHRPSEAFAPILFDMDSLNSLYEQQHPWVVSAFAFQQDHIDFPTWIMDREAELIRDVVNIYQLMNPAPLCCNGLSMPRNRRE